MWLAMACALLVIGAAVALVVHRAELRATTTAGERVTATAVPAHTTGVFRVNAASHNASIAGYTLPCTTLVCPQGIDVVKLVSGHTVLAVARLDRRLHFEFIVSGLPTPQRIPGKDRIALMLDANNGYSRTLSVIAGSRLALAVPPIVEASAQGAIPHVDDSGRLLSVVRVSGGTTVISPPPASASPPISRAVALRSADHWGRSPHSAGRAGTAVAYYGLMENSDYPNLKDVLVWVVEYPSARIPCYGCMHGAAAPAPTPLIVAVNPTSGTVVDVESGPVSIR